MDWISMTLGLACFAVFIVPIYFMQRGQAQKLRQLQHTFAQEAQARQLSISESQAWNRFYVIGLDATARKVFYLSQQDGASHFQLVDLALVKACTLAKATSDPNNSMATTKVSLVFSHTNPAQAPVHLTFFDSDVTTGLTEEVALAKSWESKVNALLKK